MPNYLKARNRKIKNYVILNSHLGFTLIELLIAITIITLIFGIIISSASIIQKKGRDSQRQSDLRNIQSILQQYYSDQSYFPSSCCYTPFILDNNSPSGELTSNMGTQTPGSSLKTYATKIPVDPVPTQKYCYRAYNSFSTATSDPTAYNCDNSSAGSRCQYYLLCAQMENSSLTSSTCQSACGSGYNLEVTTLK